MFTFCMGDGSIVKLEIRHLDRPTMVIERPEGSLTVEMGLDAAEQLSNALFTVTVEADKRRLADLANYGITSRVLSPSTKWKCSRCGQVYRN